MSSVAVCIATFQRPVGLARALDSVDGLRLEGDDHIIRVVVVDNDASASARPLVECRTAQSRWPLVYVHEPRRGISFARNTAIVNAGEADFIAFLDDDEEASPGWLASLLRVQRSTAAAVVTGPVLARYDSPLPAWADRAKVFDRPRFPTGKALHYANTGNVLIRRGVFPIGRPAFAEDLALTGGEDTHFFMRAYQQGHRIVWDDDAVVTESVPASRTELRWIMRREYRRGTTLSYCLRDLSDSPVRRLKRVGHGLARIAQGCGQVAVGVVRGPGSVVRGAATVSFGAGLLAGLAGARHEEYRTVHGT